jgi:hypothetical protein
VAQQSSSVYVQPLDTSPELAFVPPGQNVDVLGRADEALFGRWFYVCTADKVCGFVYEPRFVHQLDWSTLPVMEKDETTMLTVTALPPSSPSSWLQVAPGPLQIVHVWPASECTGPQGSWVAYFEVKVSGGDGRAYTVYWDLQKVDYEVKAEERDVAVIQWPGYRDLIIGTITVRSGGQEAKMETSVRKPTTCD